MCAHYWTEKTQTGHNDDIAALSETRFLDEGSLTEEGESYTFFWRGLPLGSNRIHGVGFAIRNGLLNNLTNSPISVSERLMTLRIPLSKNRHATVLSCYAPTLDSDEIIKDAFYDGLYHAIRNIPRTDKIILMGDFNARVGCNCQIWSVVLGMHGVGNQNLNGVRLLTTCAEHHLVITNSLFQQPNNYKTSWMHPRSKSWHLVNVTFKMFCILEHTSAECCTDHRLIRSKMRIRFHLLSRKTKLTPRLNVTCLHDLKKRSELQISVHAAL